MEAAGIDLYVKPDKSDNTKPDKPDGKVDPRKASKKTFPALYQEAREKGVIVIFGADWCGWCKMQEKSIPEGYRVLYVKVEDKGKRTAWRDLMTQWGVVPKVAGKEAKTLPTTVLAVDGIPVKHWYGWKPWRVLEKEVKQAKGEDKNEQKKIDRGRGGSVQPRVRRNRPSPRTYRTKFGRWAKRR